jgi:choline-sulfatase
VSDAQAPLPPASGTCIRDDLVVRTAASLIDAARWKMAPASAFFLRVVFARATAGFALGGTPSCAFRRRRYLRARSMAASMFLSRIAGGPTGRLLMLAMIFGLQACGTSAPPPPTQPNVLLITVDTLRPDALGWIGGKTPTPNLDRLAAASFRFPGAISPVPLTLPSHTSMMTGLYPIGHGVHDNGQVVHGDAVTLAKLLKAQGYRTGAVVSGYPLRKPFGLDRGFDFYDDTLPEGSEGWLERRAADTTAVALSFVDGAEAGKPWFLWVHYYDPHDPYTPPKEFLQPGTRGAYDGEVAYLDHAVGPLLDRVGRQPNATVTVLTADHGESFGEHGEHGHGQFIYDTTTVVPLLIHAPGRVEPGESKAAARLVDIAPTLLELLAMAPMSGIDGVSLRPLLRGEPMQVPAAYVETRQPWIAYGWAPLSALRREDWKLIVAPRSELYDLANDPGETRNLFVEKTEQADALAIDHAAIESRPRATAATVEDSQLLAQLQSLGYVGSGRVDNEVPDDVADPKDRLEEHAALLSGESLLRANRFDEAVAQFAKVLASDPNNRFATLRSGIALIKKGDLAAAKPHLLRAVELDPQQPEARFALADVLSRSGETKAAIEQWLETTRLQPRRVAAWSNLGAMFAQDGQLPKAREALAQAVSIEPENPQLLVNLAFIDRGIGRTDDAVAHLQKAARVSGAGFQYSAALGLMLLPKQGAAAARPWLAAAKPSETDFAEARMQLAMIEAYAGNPGAARTALQDAIAASPAMREAAKRNPILASLVP